MAEAQSPRAHAVTPYQQVDEAVVDELQRTFAAGGDLYQAAAWISYKNKRIILAETLDADQLVGLPARRLLMEDPGVGPMTDFKRAALAEMLLQLPQSAAGGAAGSLTEARAQDLLETVASSPHASPMLTYEPLYRDLAEGALLNDDPVALDWLKRALAHNLRFHDGDDVLSNLIDLASAYLQLGYLDTGLMMLTRLLQSNPDHIWIYRFIATGFPVLGLTALGLRGAARGLALLDEKDIDDEDDLRDEFYMARIELQTSSNRGRESEVSPEVLSAFEEALEAGFTPGPSRTPGELYDDLVPGGDKVPVKAPLRFEDLPEEVRRFAEP